MRFLLPNTKRKNAYFSSSGAVFGLITCLVLSFLAVFSLGGYAVNIILPEVSVTTVAFFAFVTVAITGIIYLFSAEWLAYPTLFGIGVIFAFLFINPISEGMYAKIEVIMMQIYRYTPDYALPYGAKHSLGLTAVTVLTVAVLGVVITHFILRGRAVIPVILTSAAAMGVFLCLERHDSGYFYIVILSVLCMILVSVQANAARAMGETHPTARIGGKTVAFLLSVALVMIPVASNREFSKSVMDAISQLTGIAPPPKGGGAFGETSGEASEDGYDNIMNDLEERQSKTDLEDVEFEELLLYYIEGAADDDDLFLRRRIYHEYSDNTWYGSPTEVSELTDKTLWNVMGSSFNENPLFFQTSQLYISAMMSPLPVPVPTGTVSYNLDNYRFFDMDKDGTVERYPAIETNTVRMAILSEKEKIEHLISHTEKNPDFVTAYNRAENMNITGNKDLDAELRHLAIYIINNYSRFSELGVGYAEEAWLHSQCPELEAALAVQKYLSETKIYTMNPQMSDRYELYDHEQDSIFNFLYVTGEGYCVQFSSAAVLLLKSIGVDARYVTGFSSRGADTTGLRSVYDSNSHAWCEVYIYGAGYFPVEMTYGAMRNSITMDAPILSNPVIITPNRPEESEISQESSEEQSAESSDTESSEAESSTTESSEAESSVISAVSEESLSEKTSKKPLIYCLCAFGCGIIITLICAIIHRKWEKRRKNVYDRRSRCAKGEGNPEEEMLNLHTQHISLMLLLGFAPLPTEKHGDYAKRIQRSQPDMPSAEKAMELFRKAEFGGTPTAEDLMHCGKHIMLLNDYVYTHTKGLARKKAYIKGLLTKPKQEEDKK